MTYEISQIYPDFDSLAGFVHPETGTTYKWLSWSEVVDLAAQCLDKIEQTGIKQVLVAESGAVPLARICAWISKKQERDISWYALKVPRDIHASFGATYRHFLNISIEELAAPNAWDKHVESFYEEKTDTALTVPPSTYFQCKGMALADILASLFEPSHIDNYEAILSQTKGSGLAKLLKKAFIYFDEYIDSGKTLWQTMRFLRLFSPKLEFKLFSYLIKIPRSGLPSSMGSSLYYLDSQEEGYTKGVYPFENRIDWIGYFYVDNSTSFQRVSIAELISSDLEDNRPVNTLIQMLNPEVVNLLEAVRGMCSIQAVASYIDEHHILQYALYRLEAMLDRDQAKTSFLFQLFDMYGPVWSPMPDAYHFDYLESFAKIEEDFDRRLREAGLVEVYASACDKIISQIAKRCEQRRLHLSHTLFSILEARYERQFFQVRGHFHGTQCQDPSLDRGQTAGAHSLS